MQQFVLKFEKKTSLHRIILEVCCRSFRHLLPQIEDRYLFTGKLDHSLKFHRLCSTISLLLQKPCYIWTLF